MNVSQRIITNLNPSMDRLQESHNSTFPPSLPNYRNQSWNCPSITQIKRQTSYPAPYSVFNRPPSIPNNTFTPTTNVPFPILNDTPNVMAESHSIQPPNQPIRNRRRYTISETKPKVCDVCSASAKSMHFGGFVCDSCKAFFRRSIQHDSHGKFECGREKKCDVHRNKNKDKAINQDRLCQYCRFEKCQHIGMKIDSVMSRSARIAMLKKKLKKVRKNSSSDGVVFTDETENQTKTANKTICCPTLTSTHVSNNVYDKLSKSDFDYIENIKGILYSNFSKRYSNNCYDNNSKSIGFLFSEVSLKLVKFFNEIQDFSTLSKSDKCVALKNGVSVSIYIYGSYNYDLQTQSWPNPAIDESLKLPKITKHGLRDFTKSPQQYLALMQFYTMYGSFIKDQICLVLLCIIAFTQSDKSFTNEEHIAKLNAKYKKMLKLYLDTKYEASQSKELYSILFDYLNAIKRLVRFHDHHEIMNEFHEVPNSLQNSAISSYKSSLLIDLTMRGIQKLNSFEFNSVFSPDEKRQILKEYSFWPSKVPQSDLSIQTLHFKNTPNKMYTKKIMCLKELLKPNDDNIVNVINKKAQQTDENQKDTTINTRKEQFSKLLLPLVQTQSLTNDKIPQVNNEKTNNEILKRSSPYRNNILDTEFIGKCLRVSTAIDK